MFIASIPIKEQLLLISITVKTNCILASIPIKEQLLYDTFISIECRVNSFNSYKGTIVINVNIYGALNYRCASIPIKEQLL